MVSESILSFLYFVNVIMSNSDMVVTFISIDELVCI